MLTTICISTGPSKTHPKNIPFPCTEAQADRIIAKIKKEHLPHHDLSADEENALKTILTAE